MPPPPVTPSPHRFVIKKPAPVRRTSLAQDQTPRPSTQQFKATPRFTFSSTPRPSPTQDLPASTPSAPRFVTPARQREDIVENIESSFEEHVLDSVEAEEQGLELGNLSADEECKTEERSSKRRRLSSSSELPNEQQPEDEYPDTLSSPPAARRLISSIASRFLLSTPGPQSTPQAPEATKPFLKPPRFRPPDPAEQAHTDPLPEHFSPHRKGQKYLAGSLAAEVRDWLFNLESAVPTASTETKDDPWIARIAVDEVSGGGRAGMTLVRGRQMRSGDAQGLVGDLGVVKVILAGEGTGNGLQRGIMVEVGKRVGIKGPVWEVVLEGEKWGVGVNWEVLA